MVEILAEGTEDMSPAQSPEESRAIGEGHLKS